MHKQKIKLLVMMMTKCLERGRTLRHFQSYTHKQKERRNRNEKAASIGGSDKDPEPEDGAEARGRPATSTPAVHLCDDIDFLALGLLRVNEPPAPESI